MQSNFFLQNLLFSRNIVSKRKYVGKKQYRQKKYYPTESFSNRGCSRNIVSFGDSILIFFFHFSCLNFRLIQSALSVFRFVAENVGQSANNFMNKRDSISSLLFSYMNRLTIFSIFRSERLQPVYHNRTCDSRGNECRSKPATAVLWRPCRQSLFFPVFQRCVFQERISKKIGSGSENCGPAGESYFPFLSVFLLAGEQ